MQGMNMKHISKKVLLAAVVVFAAFAVFLAPGVSAQSSADVCQGVAAAGGNCGEGGVTVNRVITIVINTLSVVVGIAAVIMIIIGGFKYITSGGDSSNVSSAKNTIMYAIVGLIIVAMAQMITGFVLSRAT
jgi:hypothetical protein